MCGADGFGEYRNLNESIARGKKWKVGRESEA
jgi:hypothetical protein